MSSARSQLEARGRRDWIATEEKRQRDAEDRGEYQKYVAEIEAEQRHCAPAERLKPVSYDQWRSNIPEELRNAIPAVRGAAASLKSNTTRMLGIAVDRLKNNELSDSELAGMGFQIEDRFLFPNQVSVSTVVDIFKRFAQSEPRYRYELHYDAISSFCVRNKLIPSHKNVSLAFNFLLGVHAISEPESIPEPERPEGTNQFGVNLQIEPDPELEAQKRREKYEREIIVIDPETQKGWTAYQLDHFADSETYRRLMRIPRVFKNPALEPKH